MHLNQYLNQVEKQSILLKNTVEQTSESVFRLISEKYDYKSHVRGLLLGNVQSGKTAQLLGVVTKLADNGFEVFILLTTDNLYLQKQTKERTSEALATFNVYSENDDLPFFSNKLEKPILIVLKKNTNILRKWRNLLSSSGYCNGRPIAIIDDEADAASLNTLVNKGKTSTINNHLNCIKDLSASSLFIQVTATPQSIILQSNISGSKPSFIYYFKPGNEYIGGDFIYAQPKSFCIKFTNEDELNIVRNEDIYIPDGLKSALLSYLVVCAHYKIKEFKVCNFLVHPSVKISDHFAFSRVLGEHLNLLLFSINEEESTIKTELKKQWFDLQLSKPDIENFEDIFQIVIELIENELIKIIVLNSTSDIGLNYQTGFNIIVGGNSLGRGVTIPQLQSVYYCRKAKTPQADTFWQHARMFGYDRDRGLLRIFLPPSLFQLFTELNIANKLLISQVSNNDISNIQLIYPKGVLPTRKNVVDKKALNLIVGGVNFFSSNPTQNNVDIIDELLDSYSEKEHYHEVDSEILSEILKHVGDTDGEVWNNEKYRNTIIALAKKRPTTKYALIVRKERDIGKGTGTLLSPTDRNIGDKLTDWVILTLYRAKGSSDKGWNGMPFYIPNIKLPTGICVYDTIDL